MSQTIASSKTFKLEEFVPSNLHYNALQKREGQKQKMGYINYKAGETMYNPSIQTDVIDIVCRGLPAPPSEGQPEPGAYINFPIDVTQPGGKRLYDILVAVDQVVGSAEWKAKYLGEKKPNDVAYIPLVRTPKDDDDSDEEENPRKKKSTLPKLPYVKAKFMTPRESDKVITTPMFTRTFGSKEPKVKLEGHNSVDALRKLIRLGAKLRGVLSFSKVWSGTVGSDKKYGVGLKIIGLEIQPSTGVGNAEYRESGGFLDEDDEETDAPITSTLAKAKARAPVDSDEDNEDATNHNQSDDESDNNFKTRKAAPPTDEDEDAEAEADAEEPESPLPEKKSKKGKSGSRSKNTFD
jgi:hypothetical protein